MTNNSDLSYFEMQIKKNHQAIFQGFQKYKLLSEYGKFKRFLNNPFKYTFAQFILKIYYPLFQKGWKIRTYTFFGEAMKVHLPAATDIYLTGGKSHSSEVRLTAFLTKHLKEGDVFIDVGAHFGYYSLLASKLTGKEGKVFSFEPTPESFNILASNANRKNNISVLESAVTEEAGKVTLYTFPLLHSEGNTLIRNSFSHGRSTQKQKPKSEMADSITLDSFLHSLDRSKPTYIKIDAEGGEEKIVRGGIQLFEKIYDLTVIMEFHTGTPDDSPHTNAKNTLEQLGYICHLITEEGTLEESTHDHPLFIQKKKTSENLVFKKKRNTLYTAD